jgi:hypothetical protein
MGCKCCAEIVMRGRLARKERRGEAWWIWRSHAGNAEWWTAMPKVGADPVTERVRQNIVSPTEIAKTAI